MHLVIDGQHLCVTLIRVVRADLEDGALSNNLICTADNLGVFNLIAAGRLRICHGAAMTCTIRTIVAILLIDIPQARNANHVFVDPGGGSRILSRVRLGQEQAKLS